MDDFAARDDSDNDRRELARFLKARRQRLKPAALGLKAAPRRRAAGLLREEVASAAGMSVTWYTWMEQGRPIKPSIHLLERLAKVLRLDEVEHAHLLRLAHLDNRKTHKPAVLDPALASVLHGVHPHPAYAFDALWNVIAWNEAAAALLGAFDTSDPVRGNVLLRLFLDRDWRHLFVDWEAITQSAVAQYRAATAALSLDPARGEIIGVLDRESLRFAALWKASDVAASPAWRKVLDHRKAGRLAFDYAVLSADPVRFALYTPADEQTGKAFGKLLR